MYQRPGQLSVGDAVEKLPQIGTADATIGYEKSPVYGGPDPWLGGWFSVAVGILALALLAAFTLWATGAFGASITVTDGDTIRIDASRCAWSASTRRRVAVDAL